MIENADDFIPPLADAGANWVIVHYEACRHLHRTLQLIAHHGMKPAVVLNPATRVDLILDILPMVHHVLIMSVNPGFGGQEFIPFSVDKIRRLAELRRELGLAFRIEVDGGVAHDTVAAGRPSRCGPAGRRQCCVWRGTGGRGCAWLLLAGPRSRGRDARARISAAGRMSLARLRSCGDASNVGQDSRARRFRWSGGAA